MTKTELLELITGLDCWRREPFFAVEKGAVGLRVRAWFFMKGRRIIAVHGIRNKGQAIPANELETARTRMHDWQKRFSA